MIDRQTVQKINDTADIVEVVSDYVHLVRRGANLMGLCPFHNERTPSFSVSKRKNMCYCFSCKKGGSPVNFIMQKEGISYKEALLHLAKKYGIEVVERELTDEERLAQSERESMLVANEWAMLKMEKDLHETQEGKDIGLSYLFHRGITMEAIKRFHLGYAIDRSSNLCDAAKEAGYDLMVLKKLGLVGESAQKHDYDRFRGRVIFPIINSAGKVIAFGGRDLKGGLAKYINSPESDIYKKSRELYGIFQARADIVKEDKCFLVEGYLDVIGMWQAGMKNTVASSGTALTDGQIALIHRFTPNITLIYDGDNAGIKAALRGIDMLLKHNMKVKVLLLPDGDDPDSFAKKHTPEEFREYLAAHETDIIRFKTQVLLKEMDNDPQSKISATGSIVTSLAHISDQITRDVYIQECSRILNIPESSIAKSVVRTRATLLENWKREKERNFLNQEENIATPQTVQQTGVSSEKEVQDVNKPEAPLVNVSGPATPNLVAPGSNLDNLERKIIQYCIKYAFLTLFEYTDDNGENKVLDTLSYIKEEIEIDEMEFTDPVSRKVYEKLIALRKDYEVALSEFQAKEKEAYNLRVSEGIAKIASKGMSMREIEKAEKELYNQANITFQNNCREFTKEYPGRLLASDEDDEVREMAFNLIKEPYHLSNIYLRDNNHVETEVERLESLVPRAMSEWRGEILNQKINNLLLRLKEAQENSPSPPDIASVQAELARLLVNRTQLAKEIGDRIISPKRNRR